MKLLYKALLIALFLFTKAYAQSVISVSSPDKRLKLTLHVNNDNTLYTLNYDEITFLKPSQLGLKSSAGDFTGGLSVVKQHRRLIKDDYTLTHSKVSKVQYRANQLECTLVNNNKDTIVYVFRLSNNDMAFAYRIPGNKKASPLCTIYNELTGFAMPAGTSTFITPQAPALTGYKKSKPSYEEEYTYDEPVGTPSQYKAGYTFPALYKMGNEGWMLISETGTSGSYPGTRLSDADSNGTYHIAFPQKGENNGVGDTTASGLLPLQTPWRTVTVGKNLRAIVESTVATDVVKPVVKTTRTFTPGRASWSWIIWQDASCNFDDQVKYIDLAAALHCEYILIDAWWDTKIGREKIAELVKYARTRNVGILLWYNSNGNWNETEQTPKGLMDVSEKREKEMAWMEKTGIKGIKVDFFGGDKQQTMELYHNILTDAAKHGLNVNFHGTTLPRGWERMYPNYMTSEAVLASENLVFQQSFADRFAKIATIYPFTRNVVASMDFGPVFLNSRLSRNPSRGTTRRTTDAFEIATSVIFFSALQHWALTPQNLTDKPAYLIDFLKQVPTVWDETRLIDGYPGKLCVLARRKGTRWYVAAINGEMAAKEVDVILPMLKGVKVKVIEDGLDAGSRFSAQTIRADGKFRLKLNANGGAVIYSQ